MTNERSEQDDTSELFNTLSFRVKPRQTDCAGSWALGRIGDYRFEALVFPEHAVHPSFELGDSRISKLYIRRESDRTTLVNFDRGWDTRPASPELEMVVELLTDGLASAVYGQ